MRRADRLFRLVQILRRGRLITADKLAEELEVSTRTVYRDIKDLIGSGVPVEGEAGVGYLLYEGYDLPPLMFDAEELEALSFGMTMVQAWADPKLALAATDVLQKIDSVLPDLLRPRLAKPNLVAHGDALPEPITIDVGDLRHGIRNQNKVLINYKDGKGDKSQRTLWPLGLQLYRAIWMLGAWCELRQGFRVFRLDRIAQMIVLDEFFPRERGKTHDDFLKHLEETTSA
ncbi:YafY family protein [uncultured Kiloniella sp.]|uniref:helix-turn-helix transcriptional regulator n=1 Tax=uncultured Kiloniella sp. TaxID=1133091 RepID=UPI002633D7D9|nr:YafY family protein [uncultured Kiloniella sp.]